MLVLTRKQNEEIVIGDNVKVTVLQIKGNSIRLGIEAPREVRIVRGELPPVSETPAVSSEGLAHTGQRAEVTVVFSDDRNEVGNKLDIVPFKQISSDDSEMSCGREMTPDREAKEPASIRFQQNLPTSLERNRLQQIVNELTGK